MIHLLKKDGARVRLLGCLAAVLFGLCFVASSAQAADAVCVGKATGAFWSSTSSTTAACSAGKQQVCNTTYSNFCFGGSHLPIAIIKTCTTQTCASSTPVATTPATTTPVATTPAATTPAATTGNTTTPSLTTAKLSVGVNAHNAWTGSMAMYPQSQEDAVFRLLKQNGFKTYRVDVQNDSASQAVLKRLVILGKQYGVTIRPMLYMTSNAENDAYTMAKMFAADITLWELGNELNLLGTQNYTGNINLMIKARKGVMRASSETKKTLQTSINVTSGVADIGLNSAYTTYPFLDKAVSMGLAFDYITYHYYPSADDRQSGWMKRYLDPLRKYNKKVLLNETNCAQIYSGDDGNSDVCAQTVDSILTEVRTNYADLILEVTAYELLDNKGISGAEGHFGIMYDINTPKKSFDIFVKHAKM